MGFQKRRRLFHAWLELDPVAFAAERDLGPGRVLRVAGADFHDVGRGQLVGHGLNFGAGSAAQFDPTEVAGTRADTGSLVPFGHV